MCRYNNFIIQIAMLFVRPIQGFLTRETNLLLSMDPYVVLNYEGQQHKTNPHYSGGSKPKWSETFTFDLKTINRLKVQAWSRSVLSDSLIGKGELDLRRLLLAPGRAVQQYVELYYEGKPAGKILLELALTNQAIKKRPIFEEKEGQRLRTSLPENLDFNQQISRFQNKLLPENSSAGFLVGFGRQPIPQQNKNSMVNQPMTPAQQQLANNMAKMNLNGVVKSPPPPQVPGLPHKHHRPLTPPYQGTYPLRHKLNNGGMVAQQPPNPQTLTPHKMQQPPSEQNRLRHSEAKQRPPEGQRQNHQMGAQSNVQKVGLGKTPPKSILSPGKGKRSKSNKKVTFNV